MWFFSWKKHDLICFFFFVAVFKLNEWWCHNDFEVFERRLADTMFGYIRLAAGVRMEGNIRTLACMKDRSGRIEMTFAASSLIFSSFSGLLLNKHKKSIFSETTAESHPILTFLNL